MANGHKRPVDILFPEMGTLKDQGKCPTCKETIVLSTFTDELSVKEFSISGMCQKCQDEVFETDKEADCPEFYDKNKG